MLDRHIRPTLLEALHTAHPGAAVFHEFPVCRKGRADLVAVNAAIRGYEIKSERDSLARLSLQVERYDCVFDFCAVVLAERHLKHATTIVRDHWGIFLVSNIDGECQIHEVRVSARNPNRKLDQIIRLLWKTEWLKALRERGVPAPGHLPVWKVWELLKQLPATELEEAVRNALKLRYDAGFAARQTLDDDSRTTEPIA